VVLIKKVSRKAAKYADKKLTFHINIFVLFAALREKNPREVSTYHLRIRHCIISGKSLNLPELNFHNKIRDLKRIIPFFLAIASLLGCEDKNREVFEKIQAYPVSLGNEWRYSSVSILNIYESSVSNKIIDADTVIRFTNVKIEKDTVLNDTMSVLQFSSRNDGKTTIRKQYYFVDSLGLKVYAYSNGGSHDFAKKDTKSIEKAELFSSAFPDPFLTSDIDFSVIEPAPRLNLKYPLELYSKWTYTLPFEPLNLQIDKEITGFERLIINNKSYFCYIVSWVYLDNIYYDGRKISDWISSEGLIQRRVTYRRSDLAFAEAETWTNCQLTETILLVESNLK
jgi:hypothetical protein